VVFGNGRKSERISERVTERHRDGSSSTPTLNLGES
jgi:hypothetical protein